MKDNYIENILLEANNLKNSIIGCNVKRKYKNRKLKKYHIKGFFDKVNYNALAITPINLFAMRQIRRLIKQKK